MYTLRCIVLFPAVKSWQPLLFEDFSEESQWMKGTSATAVHPVVEMRGMVVFRCLMIARLCNDEISPHTWTQCSIYFYFLSNQVIEIGKYEKCEQRPGCREQKKAQRKTETGNREKPAVVACRPLASPPCKAGTLGPDDRIVLQVGISRPLR